MTIARIARFRVDPADTEKFLQAREEMVAALRRDCPGLTEAGLGRLTDDTWIDVWRWESQADLDRALKAGPAAFPEAAAVFALTQDLTTEDVTDVDQP